jgi:hydroxymethylbilane synthase
MRALRVGSRKSPLAMAQTEWVVRILRQKLGEAPIDIVGFQTDGDRFLDASLQAIGGKGLFVKELQAAMLAGDIDMAVHSMKDMPPESPDGLMILPFGPREDARDVMIARSSHAKAKQVKFLADLPPGAVVGTSSVRRQLFLAQYYPHLEVSLLRGNVNTRLRKLEEGAYDAIILAAAGLKRLGLHERITAYLPETEFIPACGQGILAVEFRLEATGLRDLLTAAIDFDTLTALRAEKAFQRAVGGDCHTPMAAFARRNETGDGEFELFTALLDPETQSLHTHREPFFAAQAEHAAQVSFVKLQPSKN